MNERTQDLTFTVHMEDDDEYDRSTAKAAQTAKEVRAKRKRRASRRWFARCRAKTCSSRRSGCWSA